MHDCVIQVVQRLLKNDEVKINSKNLGGCNFWQVQRPIRGDMRRVLRRARLLLSVFPNSRAAINSHEGYRRSYPFHCLRLFMLRLQMTVPNELRSILLVVAVLYLTINFQLVLTPPGGLWQDNCDPQQNPVGCTVPHQAGTLIMGNILFRQLYYYFNLISFSVTLTLLILLLPWSSPLSLLFLIPMFLLVACYVLALVVVTLS